MNNIAIGILIKNQKALVDSGGNVIFECPICKRMRLVVNFCWSTQKALIAIEKNPMVQLICMICDYRIMRLNISFDKLTFFKKVVKGFINNVN